MRDEVATGASAATHRPKNILLIAIDDLRDELGCYGRPHVQSPSLDALAQRSTLFTKHFVQVPTCGASRYAFLTGRSPAASRAMQNNAFYGGKSRLSDVQLEGAQTMPELFRRSGYHTVQIGKVSHTPDGKVFAYDGKGDGRAEMPHAWDECSTPYGPWKRGWGCFFAYEGGIHREDGQGHRELMEFTAERDEDLPDGLIAARAEREIGALALREQPFFLAVGFYKPHLPFVATRDDWEAYDDVPIPDADVPSMTASKYGHKSGEFFRYRNAFGKRRPLDLESRRTARRAYFACVRFVDRQVGRVLSALERAGLADDTIVVVWGDHGWHLGDSGIWGKHTPFDRALRSTLMIHAPGLPAAAGRRCDALVESIDVYPTLVDLAQPRFGETSHPLDGRSLLPLLDGTAQQVRAVACSYWRQAVSVRSPTHRLIVRTRASGAKRSVELYDLTDGPDPMRNLAASQPALVTELLGAARTW